jgi:hypothetical protein
MGKSASRVIKMSLDYKKLLKEMEGLTVEQLKSRILALEAENDGLKKMIEVYKKNLEDVLLNKGIPDDVVVKIAKLLERM